MHYMLKVRLQIDLSHKPHKHLANVFEMGELKEDAVCVNFTHTASDGKTQYIGKNQSPYLIPKLREKTL